jgi:hypothetical protein
LGAFAEYAEWICTYTENTRNESVPVLRIRGMNLYQYWEYSEWICSCPENTRNECVYILRICGMNLFVYWENVEWICTYMENTLRKMSYIFKRNLNMHMRWIHGMNLFLCWEYAEGICSYWEYGEWICTCTENMRSVQKVVYLGEFETKIYIILRRLSPRYVRLAKPVYTRISHASAPLR